MSGKPNLNANIEKHILHSVQDEFWALMALMKFQWHLVLLFFIGIALLIYVINPFPPTHIRIATGQPGSTFDVIGQHYQAYFAKQGVTLELIPSKGAVENLEWLKNKKVEAVLSQGGLAPQGSHSIVSLGSISYQPLWLFYRSSEAVDTQNPASFLKTKKISINVPGSGTRLLTESLLKLHKIKVEEAKNLVSLSSQDSIQSFLSGQIDAMFLVAGMESQNIRRLLETPGVKLFHFSLAKAYQRDVEYIEAIDIPRGAVSLDPILPEQDIEMIATTTTLLVDKKLHPATQYLFLKAAHDIDVTEKQFFKRANGFPAYTDSAVPQSAVSQKYFTKGAPFLEGYTSYWIASFFDQAWFFILALVAIGYPLIKIIPRYRMIHFEFCMDDAYGELKHFEHDLPALSSAEEFALFQQNFQRFEEKIKHFWVPSGGKQNYYLLVNALEIVKGKMEKLQF